MEVFVCIGSGLLAIAFFDFIVFLRGWWLPLIPPGLSWSISAVAITAYLSYQETVHRAALMQLFSHVSKQVAEGIWRDREQFLDGQRPRPQQLVATVLFTDPWVYLGVGKITSRGTHGLAQRIYGAHGKAGKCPWRSNRTIYWRCHSCCLWCADSSKDEEEISQDAINAVNCALAMETTLRDLNRHWLAQNQPATAMRIGIYTGPMVAGSLGSSDRLEYVVIGDTVNVASRLESFDKELFFR